MENHICQACIVGSGSCSDVFCKNYSTKNGEVDTATLSPWHPDYKKPESPPIVVCVCGRASSCGMHRCDFPAAGA